MCDNNCKQGSWFWWGLYCFLLIYLSAEGSHDLSGAALTSAVVRVFNNTHQHDIIEQSFSHLLIFITSNGDGAQQITCRPLAGHCLLFAWCPIDPLPAIFSYIVNLHHSLRAKVFKMFGVVLSPTLDDLISYTGWYKLLSEGKQKGRDCAAMG